MRDQTLCVLRQPVSHEGYASLAVPTHRASTIVFADAQSYAERGKRGPDGYTYGLHGTPTTRALEAALTGLHRGIRTALLPSGQAATAVVFQTVLMPGDTVLVPDTAYPPTKGLCANFLEPRGIRHRIYDPLAAAGIAEQMDPSVKLVWTESPGSTTMDIQDIPAIVRVAHAQGALVGCDNTWATPLYFKPLDHGVDFAMEALTKYVGGHSDLLMGSITVRDLPLHRRLKDTMRMLGYGVSPDEVALALRGLETMGVRLAHASRVALDLAARIAERVPSELVLHPALPSFPGHALWKRDFTGSSGVFSLVIPHAAEAALPDLLTATKTFSIGASWGGTHSLLAPMNVTKDRHLGPASHSGTILRISIGVEDPTDLWADLEPIVDAVAAAAVHRSDAA